MSMAEFLQIPLALIAMVVKTQAAQAHAESEDHVA